MLDEPTWARLEHAINNFPVMMGGVMMIASARAAAGQGGDGPSGDPGAAVRALVRDRLGRAQLDEATARRVRAGLTPEEARGAIEACDQFAQDLPPLTARLDEGQMLSYITRAGPGDPAFEAFMQRFMGVAQRIQAIFQQSA